MDLLSKVFKELMEMDNDTILQEINKNCDKNVREGFCFGASIIYAQDPDHPRKGLCEKCKMLDVL